MATQPADYFFERPSSAKYQVDMTIIRQYQWCFAAGRLLNRCAWVSRHRHHDSHRVVGFVIYLRQECVDVRRIGLFLGKFQFNQISCAFDLREPSI